MLGYPGCWWGRLARLAGARFVGVALLASSAAACLYEHPVVGILPYETEDDDELLLLGALGLAAASAGSVCVTAASGFEAGSGTAGDPYLICNAEQLQNMRQDLGASYRISASFDASGSAAFDGGLGFSPVGDGSTPFTGTLDGQYFTISGLTIARAGVTRMGLFGQTSGATVQRLNLAQVNISGGSRTGGIAGIFAGGVLEEVSTTGSISGTGDRVGGVVGGPESSAVMQRVYSKASVVMNGSTLNVGGLAGLIRSQASIADSYFAGSVSSPTATDKVGGIVGHVFNSGGCAALSVANVYNSGTISSPGFANHAGLFGQLQGCDVLNSYCLDVQDAGNQECRNNASGPIFAGGGRRTATQLACTITANESCGGTLNFVNWNTGVWFFGDANQNPWLQWSGTTPP